MGDRSPAKLGRPRLFNPAITRKETSNRGSGEGISLSKLKDTNFQSTSSFRYDSPGTGMKSTQEIPLDWSLFENHTFFNSAQSKVSTAFDIIVNKYPFDGTSKEVEGFEDGLTGFEKYVLDLFPKNTGYLLFSGTSKSEIGSGGTYISVKDSAGADYPDFSRNDTGNTIMDFDTNPFSFEFHLYVEPQQNYNQIICQKRESQNSCVSIAISGSDSKSKCNLIFSVTSGSQSIFASSSIEKGKFSHICASFERGVTNNLKIYVSESLAASSSMSYEFGSLSLNRSPLTIGSGSSFVVKSDNLESNASTFVPVQTLSGAMDDFRLFHSLRSPHIQRTKGYRTIYASSDLKLYLKFNEPSGSYTSKSSVLDSSGNSLHSNITNYTDALRVTSSLSQNPMSQENTNRNPILFPSHNSVANLNQRLMSSASYYDQVNPNLITRMIPIHYLLEGQAAQGLENVEGQIGKETTATSIPGSSNIGSAQHLTAFMLLWSKYFDEIKLFIDHFSRLIHPDYNDQETVSSKFLPFIADYYGIQLPSFFPDTNPTQFIDGEDLQNDYTKALQSLNYVQSELWKRILINMNEINRSKGTVHSVKTLIKSAGINPDNLMTIREFGGPTKRSLTGRREKKIEVSTSLDFSGTLAPITPAAVGHEGFSSSIPHITSPFLSSSRVEIGYPDQKGDMVLKKKYPPHGISNNPSDGLLTSGSFTFEAFYQFPRIMTGSNKISYPAEQSLARLGVSSSNAAVPRAWVTTNLILLSGTHNSITSSGSTLRLYSRPGMNGATDKLLKLHLTGVDVFDGSLWSISFGRQRADERDTTTSLKYLSSEVSTAGSSSYFLRAARQSFGEIKDVFATSSFFKESNGSNAFESVHSLYNTSGSILTIGSQSLANFDGTGYNIFLNDTSLESRRGASAGDLSKSHQTLFAGQVSQMRFWSKSLTINEWKEHVRNFKSFGVDNPLVSYNFNKISTGSFQRLRIDASTDQPVTASDASGKITITDFTQNGMPLTGSGFETSIEIIKPESFYFSHLSPKFDLSQTDNKVRIRSYKKKSLIDENTYATSTPEYEVLRSEEPDDDTRFSIEFSAVKAIDEDIMNMFSSLDFFDSAMGMPNLVFDEFYPDIEQARKIYFNRLIDKPDFQVFFDMYKWFNTSLGTMIEQIIPRKTKFLGINFVIESHVLERNRFRYLFDEIYLKAIDRDTDRGNLLLSQIVGNARKF